MTYEEADAYIASVPKFTEKNKPENTLEMLRRLGHPEREMKVIHVAGTNGKGSVCAFLSSMLTTAGRRTGLFISPHLVKLTERFQIDNRPVEDDVFLAAYEKVMRIVKEMQADGFFHPAYFELLFVVGLEIFREERVEFAVLETGLGGRLDATNTVEHPLVSVITSISLDHTEILGDTIPEIAAEKAGIIKPGVPVVYDGNNPEAEQVILETARSRGSEAVGLQGDQLRIVGRTEKSIDFRLDVPYYKESIVTVPYLAPYQVRNSALALLAMETLDPEHTILLEMRLKGVRQTRWEGRMETVLPGIVVDGAHNEDGVREFVRTLELVGRDCRVVLLFSAVVEKNYPLMIHEICASGCVDEVVVTEIAGSRNVPARELARVFRREADVPVTAEPSIREAFWIAREKRRDGLLFCVGSLYLVGAIKEVIEENDR